MRFLPYLFGPELYWAIVCVGVKVATRRGLPPDLSVTRWLDQYWAVLPLVVVPLTFAFFLWPGAGRWWLLLRIDLAIAVGLAWGTTKYCEVNLIRPKATPALSKLIRGELAPAQTWETKLTQAGDADTAEQVAAAKSQAWGELVRERKLGYLGAIGCSKSCRNSTAIRRR